MIGKPFDAIVVGEVNIDLVMWDIPMPENEKEKLAKDMHFTMGGSSAITAHNLSVIGSKVAFMGKTGYDIFGDFIIQKLKEGAVDTSAIMRDDTLKTGVTVVIANPPKRAMLTYIGANVDLTIDDIDWNVVSKARHLHLGSFFLQTGLRKDVPKLFCKAKELGLTTSMDTNWDPNEEWGDDLFAALRYTDIFLPNDDEALQMTRKKTLDEAIYKLGNLIKVVVIKKGRHGATVYTENQIYRAPGFAVQAIETTGAGDSFNAGFLYKYLQGSKWQSCLDYGNACGALAVTSLGGTGAFMESHDIKIKLDKLLANV
jgi:sugar/nucleoside kinase (ribokinase family)